VAAKAPKASEVEAGQRVYTPLVLRGYDLFVIGFSNRFVWRCRSARMLAQYDRFVGSRHLDVGVGTGWFLDRCRWPVERPQITLLDLNENALAAAAERIRRYTPRSVRANVLEPLPLGEARFDSIACNFLLHCVPGAMEWKAATIAANLLPFLEPGGVLFGSTILGKGVRHNRLGHLLMRVYNRKGIFANLADDRDSLARGLAKSMSDVEIEIVGTVAHFTARATRPATR
jgi:2-polyprenyl-3-methyl-5-hydroxy-6-metoxy-1,4-benzoquinol methylase